MDKISIDIKNLTKKYRDGTLALDNVSLQIKKGEIFALLGPNGAGKTTLINIVCGLSNKTSGEVLVLGKNTVSDYLYTRSVIGLVQQEISGEVMLSVEQQIRYQCGYFGQKVSKQEVDHILKRLSLYEKRKKFPRRLSGGMKRRLMIAKALIHKPKIIFLDEPTAGVDVGLRKELWNFILELKSMGATIVLTTHYLEEAESIADRIAIINHGKVIITDDKVALVKRLGQKKIKFYFEKKIAILPTSLKKFGLIRTNEGKAWEMESVRARDIGKIGNVIVAIKKAHLPLIDIETHESRLEDIFVEMIRKRNT